MITRYKLKISQAKFVITTLDSTVFLQVWKFLSYNWVGKTITVITEFLKRLPRSIKKMLYLMILKAAKFITKNILTLKNG